MATVGGDAQGARCLAGSYGDRATAVGTQGAGVNQASAILGVNAFGGGAADSTRGFLSTLGTASSAVANAYGRVASYLPQVAMAIEEAQQAEQARQKAQETLTAAQARQGQAELQVTIATAAAHGGSSPLGPLAVPSIGAVTGPSPAQAQALAEAQQALTQATHLVEEAQTAWRAADHRFEDDNRRRLSVLREFASICRQEAAIAGRAIPEPPTPRFGLLSSLGFTTASFQGLALKGDASLIADLPKLVSAEAARGQLAAVVTAIDDRNYNAINTMVNPPAPPRPVHHGGGGIGGFFASLGGGALHVVTSLPGDAANLGKGAVDGTVGTVTGIGGMVLHPVRTVEGLGSALVHPERTVLRVVDLPMLEHNPFGYIGNLVPSVAGAVVTDGASTSSDAASALADTERVTRDTSLAAARDAAPDSSAMLPHLADANAADQRAAAADAAAARSEKLHASLETSGKISDQTGLVAAAQPPAPCSSDTGSPALPGMVVGHVAEHALR